MPWSVRAARPPAPAAAVRRNEATREQLVGRLGRESRLGARDRGEARLPFEPAAARDTGVRRRPGPWRRRTPAASLRARRARRHRARAGGAAACAAISRATSSSASIRSRSRAASSKRRSCGEPLQLRAQLRQRIVERLPLDALQRARRELRAASALDRPELARLSTSRRRCRRGGGDRGSGRVAPSARSPAGAARGSAAAPRAMLRARSRARATRSARARRARLSTAGRWRSRAEVGAQPRAQVAGAADVEHLVVPSRKR